MHQPALVTVAVLLFSLTTVYGGNVLVFPLEGSHWVNMKVLIEELHSRGHSITVIRPTTNWYIKEKSPHYSCITIPVSGGGIVEEVFSLFVTRKLQIQREGGSFWSRMSLELEVAKQIYELHKDLVVMMTTIFEDAELMHSLHDANYDLVLTDPAIGGGVFLAHRIGLPLVFNVRWTVLGEGHFTIAPSPLSYVPLPGALLTDKMTFQERVINVLFYLFTRFQFAYVIDPNYIPFVHRYFGPDVHYMSLFQAADIWLMRNDFTFEFPRPTMPNVVYMGGFQCKPSKPLPQDMEDFVQKSGDHGVIMMSLGTLVGQLPEDIAEDIAAAFAKLPQRIVWRHTGKRPTSVGNNTLLVDWLPQNDLLGHPKTRAFVAHGGTNGVQEAIYHGVPIVGLPLVFDQHDNLNRMRAKGVAKIVDIATVDSDIFLEAVKAVLYEPNYRENMQRLSRLHRDQPMKPLDRAMFWIEFVMRNKGAAHLRTESYKMSWFTYHSVDVVATLLAIVLLIMLVSTLAVRFLWHKVFCRRKVKHE
ncbi:UDP-glucuronosyltransferase 2A1-like [Oncorhynchus keta]|uniref:UDP-glucuronosyltransferase 2A1-like n=1 Tax=Oncorhynchus keta TaxID=8018 RepID=UPI00227C22BD|nr:UDP-glucuronosyltransferase 2A1-like [Oncorhynchus keta]XP_052317330.1 UDP-glucuronosyltransferase 2A1-like [Oncorhynchus keta]XP_052317331.1 UDP-glucuronosyltransferase 2A1-like [Oncorhynchus keta]